MYRQKKYTTPSCLVQCFRGGRLRVRPRRTRTATFHTSPCEKQLQASLASLVEVFACLATDANKLKISSFYLYLTFTAQENLQSTAQLLLELDCVHSSF